MAAKKNIKKTTLTHGLTIRMTPGERERLEELRRRMGLRSCGEVVRQALGPHLEGVGEYAGT